MQHCTEAECLVVNEFNFQLDPLERHDERGPRIRRREIGAGLGQFFKGWKLLYEVKRYVEDGQHHHPGRQRFHEWIEFYSAQRHS